MAEFMDDLKGLGKTIAEKAEVVVKKTGEVMEDVAKKTEETLEIQKIKSQIRVLKKGNDRDFQDIGKMIYERFQKNEEVDSEFVELCEAIQEREESIDENKKQIAKIKGLDVCPKCKEHVEPNVVYCPKCGTKMEDGCCDEDVFEEETVDATEE